MSDTLEHDWRQNPHVADQKYCVRCNAVVHVPHEHSQRLKPLYRLSDRRTYSLEEPACAVAE